MSKFLLPSLCCVFGGCTHATASMRRSEDSWHWPLEAGEGRKASTVNSRSVLKGLDSLKGKKKYSVQRAQVGWAGVTPLLEEEESDSSRNRWRKGCLRFPTWAEEQNEDLTSFCGCPYASPRDRIKWPCHLPHRPLFSSLVWSFPALHYWRSDPEREEAGIGVCPAPAPPG